MTDDLSKKVLLLCVPRHTICIFVVTLCCAGGLGSGGCAKHPTSRTTAAANSAADPTPDELLPPGATKAEIQPRIGTNSSVPSAVSLWTQGFKSADSLDQVTSQIELKLKPLGYTLDLEMTGNTPDGRPRIVRFFDKPGRQIMVIAVRQKKGWNPDYADFILLLSAS